MSTLETGLYETRSHISASSRSSKGSVSSSTVAIARAKAEAAKMRVHYAEQERQLKVEKARMEAALEKLSVEKEAAAAVAEAEALEEAAIYASERFSNMSRRSSGHQDNLQRTSDYVQLHAKSGDDLCSDPGEESNLQKELRQQPVTQKVTSAHQMPNIKLDSSLIFSRPSVQPKLEPTNVWSTTVATNKNEPLDCDYYHSSMSKNRCNSIGPAQSNLPSDLPCRDQGMTDLVKFFARRELITKGLTKFNDRPEGYRAWRSSFKNMIQDLDLSVSEEVDLLVKWLGNESAEHAKRIRDININYPSRGLKMIWERLEECYGSPEVVENALFKRIEDFPKIPNKGFQKLRELSDLLMELEVAKGEGDLQGLAFLDTARGVNPIVQKLPYSLQEKWITQGSKYKQQHNVSFPPFSFFVDFIRQQSKTRNDPSFDFSTFETTYTRTNKPASLRNPKATPVAVHKTSISAVHPSTRDPCKDCPLHKKPHPLQKCRGFREKPLKDRKAFLKENQICYKCCASTSHRAKDCTANIECSECHSKEHTTALHPEPAPWTLTPSDQATEHGGEEKVSVLPEVSPQCTQVCGEGLRGKSCSKICLVKVYPIGHKEMAVRLYTILDDQSNRSLASSTFFDIFNIEGHSSPYSLKTCTGVTEEAGRRATGFQIESMDGETSLPLPKLIECNQIPNNREEIPTPEAALPHKHLKTMAHLIPALDPKAQIVLLLGRDIIRVHKVRKQVNGPQNSPFAQKLDLGWVIVGDVCLGNVHKPSTVNSYCTNTLENGRPSFFQPCPNRFLIRDTPSSISYSDSTEIGTHFCDEDRDHLGCTVFQRTKDDHKIAPSIEDEAFLDIMEQGFFKDEANNWVAPLPFKTQRRHLPDNRDQALKRFFSLRRNLLRRPDMSEHFFTFMEKIFGNGHAEVAPPLREKEEHWYLPIFGVYHPKKPGQIRVVFDSSSQYEGVSLNDALMTGPDLNNTLLGVLIRFRKGLISIVADIQQMFHCFLVKEEHRNFLRFFWFKDNDQTKDIMEYRMKVHVFGNSPSPAVAIYGLKRSAREGEEEYGQDVRQFVERDFYVDDGLKSLPSPDAAIDLLKRTQSMLACSNLKLHKIASNSKAVMKAFPTQDHANDLKDLDLATATIPLQRSLGLNWDLNNDTFTFQVDQKPKPFTRRGVLSTINSIYDPLGFAAPVTIQGKMLLRDLTADTCDWDSPLSPEKETLWVKWRDSLVALSDLHVPRPYAHVPIAEVKSKELCVFCDASVKAIAAVAYLKTIDIKGQTHIGFVIGKAKLAPSPEPTIPRLELCAAVLAVELAELIVTEIDMTLDDTEFHTDSKVVLGYIYNESRRFYVYVHNRVHRIRKSSKPTQWRYVPTDHNPADHATRAVPAPLLKDTTWLTGPTFLYKPVLDTHKKSTYELLDPDSDAEVRPQVSTLITTLSSKQLGSKRFNRFSTWKSLNRAVSCLIHIARTFRATPARSSHCRGWHRCPKGYTVDELTQAKDVVIHCVQQEIYARELESLQNQKNVPKDSSLRKLDPYIDANGLLRVGGRVSNAQLDSNECHPVILPNDHVASLLVRHYHEQTKHQGRLFTEGALCTAGFWIVGAKRLVSNVIFRCVTCRKLRGTFQSQKMASLPADRLSTEPPFTNVGLDVFGPWSVTTRRTRGGEANSKRWAVLFTCMSIRAVHIEVIESLDTSSFINALRRFISIRGPVKQIRSDRGTNFIGACKELNIPSNIDSDHVRRYLANQGCTWSFNPPHSSHMGGSWERMIGIARRILDSIFLHEGTSRLTHETLTTLMAEVVAIINARPLMPISRDPDDPPLLTPSTLLTQKFDAITAPAGEFDSKDLYKCQWRRVQSLANVFWEKWRKQYISTLQTRNKWHSSKPNMEVGNVVLVKDSQSKRNEWPMGLITKVFPSEDGKVRKVEVKLCKQNEPKLFFRPVTELILLLTTKRS
ncbi:uncharacterized protein [Eleutherodactylus coqui]|uniref:uncharacterized protein n=1 Tax=Eleutherodactylus coqui TaxID=57060 RepID=UPI0034637455